MQIFYEATFALKRRFYGLRVILILLLLLFVPLVAITEDSLSDLEMRIMGKKMINLPIEERVSLLEKALNLTANSKLSIKYRMANVYAASKNQVNEHQKNLAVQAYNQGVDATEVKQYEKAIESYKRSISLNPDFVEAYNNLGNLLEQLNYFDEAKKIYKAALLYAPGSALLHRNLGIVYEKTGYVREAVNEYRKYLQLTNQVDENIAAIVANYDAQHNKRNKSLDYSELAHDGSNGKNLIWPEKLNPIPVFIKFDQDQVSFLPSIRESLHEWENASQGRIRFREVDRVADSSIRIILQEGPLSHPYLEVAHASYDVTDEFDLSRFDLKVTIKVNTGERIIPITLEDRLLQVKRLAMHEIGHAIGIWGHSQDPDDIMYLRPTVSRLSLRDIRTLHKLYGG